jgi:hypothetical protein
MTLSYSITSPLISPFQWSKSNDVTKSMEFEHERVMRHRGSIHVVDSHLSVCGRMVTREHISQVDGGFDRAERDGIRLGRAATVSYVNK